MWTTELDQALKNVKKCLIITLVSVFCDVIKATRTCTDASRQGQVWDLSRNNKQWKDNGTLFK